MNMSQRALWDGFPPPLPDVKPKVRWVLENFPEARNCDGTVMVKVWELWYGLDQIIPDEAMRDALADFLDKKGIPTPETIRRRRCEIQNDEGCYLPSPEVQKYRQAMARKGPVD